MKKIITFALTIMVVLAVSSSVAMANPAFPRHSWGSYAAVVGPGGNGGHVYAAQHCMVSLSSVSPGTPDGVYGTNTKNSIIAYQKAKGLTQDGKAGTGTFGKIQSQSIWEDGNSGIEMGYGVGSGSRAQYLMFIHKNNGDWMTFTRAGGRIKMW